MQLRVISSGSVGNCYLLENETECLIIELGTQFKAVKQALQFNLKKVVGCLVSHEHGDHSKAVVQAANSGLDVYMSPGTLKALDLENHRLKTVVHNQKFWVGNFRVLAFNVKHDCAEPLGFLIHHPDCGTVCFITDSLFVEYNFPPLDHLIIEANYCEKIIHDHVINGRIANVRADRVICNHMSIQTCIKFVQTQDLSNVRNIVIVHLSDSNSNAAEFKDKMQRATGKKAVTASKGQIINFSTNPF